MKKLSVVVMALLLCGCERNFNDLLSDARAALAEKNYTVVIDDVNLAIPRWRDRDNVTKKSEAYELLGKAYHALKKMDQAADAYEQAVKLSNNAYDSAYTLGLMHMAGSQYEQAKEMFQAALRMKRDDPLALLGLGDSLYNLGKYSEARGVYRRIIEVSPGVTDALANLKLVDQKIAAKESPSKKGSTRVHRRRR